MSAQKKKKGDGKWKEKIKPVRALRGTEGIRSFITLQNIASPSGICNLHSENELSNQNH